MYGVLELALAVVVLLTPISFGLINGLYRDIYPSLESSPQALAALRVVMAVLALAPATILMGATLPTLTRHLARDVTLSGAFSLLYAANTVGAILGTIVAGFILIELFGLSGALAIGAGCSATAGLAALLAVARAGPRRAASLRTTRRRTTRRRAGRRTRRWPTPARAAPGAHRWPSSPA